jgi:hypothetical protein
MAHATRDMAFAGCPGCVQPYGIGLDVRARPEVVELDDAPG